MLRSSFLALALLALTAIPAAAQLVGNDTAPGSSCAGFPDGATRVSADADLDGKEITLICDGSVWQPVASGASTLGDLTDVDTTGATDGAYLYYSGGNWLVTAGGNPACGATGFNTPGTYSYTVPFGYQSITVRLWGGGGSGGGANSSCNGSINGASGGSTTISSLGLTAAGGAGGICGETGLYGAGGAGGAASGGDTNLAGAGGGQGASSESGAGGSAPNGGGAGGTSVTFDATPGNDGAAPGGGGSGGFEDSNRVGGGGGSGAYVEIVYTSGELIAGSTINDIVVGAGGTVNTGTFEEGGIGGDGRATITCSSTPAPPPTPKTVFVTANTYTGNLGGVTGADAICQGRADGAGLTGTYLAWISDSSSTEPDERFTKNTEAYELVNGTKIADNWSDLTDGTLDNAISLDANGQTVSSTNVWTATSVAGNAFGSSCSGWTTSSSFSDGWYGHNDSTSSTWTDSSFNQYDCNLVKRLYCFEQ